MLRDLVGQTTTAPGTNTTITLGTALAGFRAFSANNAFTNGALVFYYLTDNSISEWGYATLVTGSPDTLTGRTPISNSSGTTSRLNFSGTTYCYNAVPSARALYIDNNGAVASTALLSLTATQHVVSGSYYTTGQGVDLDGGGTIRVGAVAATNGYAFEAFYNNTVPAGSISFNGSGVAYNTTSDYRLKITFGPTDGALIDEIPVHLAAWNSAPDHRFPMVLAHELAEVAGFAVWGEKDAINPKTGEIEPQQVSYSVLIPAIIARLQKRGRQIEDMARSMASMERSMREMETKMRAMQRFTGNT